MVLNNKICLIRYVNVIIIVCRQAQPCNSYYAPLDTHHTIDISHERNNGVSYYYQYVCHSDEIAWKLK